MSKLVIAEKPMLARDIARAITGKEVSESARLPISGNGYTVCACAGHLLELVEPDTIDPKWGMPWSSVTVNFGSPLQQDATVFLDTNNMGEAMLSKISQLGAFTGQFMRSGFCSYPAFTFDTEVMGNMRDLNEFASADHMSLAKMQDACHAALENIYGSEFTDALESGYDLNAESHDCTSGSAVLETCDTTRAEQPTNHVKGVR